MRHNKQKILIEGFYEGNLITENSPIKYNQSVELNVISPFYGANKPNLFYNINDEKKYQPLDKGLILLNNLSSGAQKVKFIIKMVINLLVLQIINLKYEDLGIFLLE